MEVSYLFINKQRELRAGWRLLLYLALTGILVFAVVATYNAAATRLFGRSSGREILGLALLCAAALFTAFLMLRFVDKRPFAAIGFALHRRVWIEIGQGFFQGFALVSLVFLVEWGGGWVGVSQPALRVLEVFRSLGYYIVLFALAGAFEEIAARGYAFQALVQGTGKTVAVCISSLIFGLGHAGNAHANAFSIINTIFAGMWLSVAYLKTRSLWLPTSLHMTWNLALGFVYGFPVSGAPLPQSIVRLSERGPVWLTGGNYGPEAGAVTTLVLILATVYIWRSDNVRPSESATALWHTPEPAKTDD